MNVYSYDDVYRPVSRWNREPLITSQSADQTPWGLSLELLQNCQGDLASILPKDVAELLDEMVADVGTTQELVFALILSTSAIAVQGVFDVQHLNAGMKPIPASLFVIGIAGSTQRKSTVLQILTKVYEDYQRSEAQSDLKVKVREALCRGWRKKCNELYAQIEGSFNDAEKVVELAAQLAELEAVMPGRGKSGINLVNRDISLSALLQGIETQSPSTSSVLNEARDILSQLQRLMGKLNELWDGLTIKRDRTTTEPVLQFDPRFSMTWIIQPKKWYEYIRDNGVDYLESGFGGRTLVVVCPERKPTGEIRRHSIATTARDRHNSRIKKLIDLFDSKLKSGSVNNRDVLIRSEGANEQYLKTCSWVEVNLNKGGYFEHIPEFGGRCAEQIMRIAGILHVIAGCEGTEISEKITRSAILVMRFMAEQHKRLFDGLRKPLGEYYAEKVQQLILQCFNVGEVQPITVRYVQQRAWVDGSRLKKYQVIEALKALANHGIIQLVRGHRGRDDIVSFWLNREHFIRLSRPVGFFSPT